MKTTAILLLLLLLLKLPSSSQTPCWVEDFNSSQDWTLEENWTIGGGLLQFYWNPAVYNFDLSANSPVITLPENVRELIVNQFLDTFGSSNPSEVAEISIVINGEPVVLWSYEISNGNWGQTSGTELVLDISSYAGMEAQIKLRTYGLTTFQWDLWNVFSLQVTALYPTDLSISQFDGPDSINPNETGTWNISVKNLGYEVQSNFVLELFCLKYNEIVATTTITESINPQETKVYNLEWTPETAYNTVLHSKVILEGDPFAENNISKGHFVRIKPDIDFSVLVWDYDNSIETVTDPELGDIIQPSTGLERALQSAGISYDLVYYLPNNLNDYDMIFSTMGCYCVD